MAHRLKSSVMNLGSRRPHAWPFLVILSLLPLLLIVHLGSHSRLADDDFCHLTAGLEFGPWGNVLYWRSSLNGSYSFYLLHGLFAPLDVRAPGASAMIIVATWLFGIIGLIVYGIRLLGWQKLPLTKITILAAALVWLSINGLPSPLSLFWFSASLRHTFPIAILVIALAACSAAAPRVRSRRRLATACVIFALVAFVNAGMAETFAVVQLLLLTSLPIAIYAMLPAAIKRYSLYLGASGCAATVLALLMMMTSPGVARRLAMYEVREPFALRMSSPILPKVFEQYLSILMAPEMITAFVGMIFTSLFLLLVVQRPANTSPIRKPFQLGLCPLLICLLAQLALLPLVWTHQSDNPLVFGRFSPAYICVVATQFLLLLSLAAIILARPRINFLLLNKPTYWVAIPILTLGLILFLFSLTQLRSINPRAATYISCSIFLFLLVLLWLFYSFSIAAEKSHIFAAAIRMILIMVACSLSLVVLNYMIGGRQFLYNLSFVSFAVAFSGFICGISLGIAINQANFAAPAVHPIRVLAYGSAIVAFAIWLGILIGYARNIPRFEQYSHAWDERHQLILSNRLGGVLMTEVPPLAIDLPSVLGYRGRDDYWQSPCASAEITALIEARYRA
ncbi:MAG: hypothetical protein OXG84_18200 [Chloroflexi bacterium]|nr:hypothetical protein [Chloroflexota bacterium]